MSGAILISLNILSHPQDEEDKEEFRLLCESAGIKELGFITGQRKSPDAALFAGTGKVEEIGTHQRATGAQLVVFNHVLSPVQQRNLERALVCAVIDRNGLILNIFAQRARSHEGKIQVELAQLRYQSARLVRGWSHLERQKGGIGLRGGPGETQLELDKRLLAQQVRRLEQQLEKVVQQRQTQKRARVRRALPSVAIVGYTNVGKSTLFNALTQAHTYAANQLFATLDPLTRRMSWSNLPVLVSDTVGFIRHLPHALVAAFRSTLEETASADLLLHVVDSASPRREEQIEDVNKVLAEIGAEKVPQLQVWNRIDIEGRLFPGVIKDTTGQVARVCLSAKNGAGVADLKHWLSEWTIAYHQRNR